MTLFRRPLPAPARFIAPRPGPRTRVGPLPSGILFGTAALVSGGLALPIGLHAAVNITMWAVGEKGAPGFVALTIDPIQTATAARFSPMIGAVVPLLVSAALWRWYPRLAGDDLVPVPHA